MLFVINGIRQVTFPAFDSITRNHLALLRFPAYYAVGFALVGTGAIALLLSCGSPALSRRRWTTALVLVATSLVLMVVDYQWVYQPLAAMLGPVESARPANFQTYHKASESINILHVGLVLFAALLINLPPRPPAHSTGTPAASAS